MDAPTLTRSWPALAAVGAGLIQLALGAGTATAASGGMLLRAAAVTLVLLGAAATVWGVVALARGRAVVPRAGMAGALAGVLACAWALAADPVRVSALAVAAASLLLCVLGGLCAIEVRRKRRSSADGASSGRTGVIGILVAAAAVAALVTPALAATQSGLLGPDRAGDPGIVTHSH